MSVITQGKSLGKQVKLIKPIVARLEHAAAYCQDTKGVYCDGRPDEIFDSKFYTLEEAVNDLTELQAIVAKALKKLEEPV